MCLMAKVIVVFFFDDYFADPPIIPHERKIFQLRLTRFDAEQMSWSQSATNAIIICQRGEYKNRNKKPVEASNLILFVRSVN